MKNVILLPVEFHSNKKRKEWKITRLQLKSRAISTLLQENPKYFPLELNETLNRIDLFLVNF